MTFDTTENPPMLDNAHDLSSRLRSGRSKDHVGKLAAKTNSTTHNLPLNEVHYEETETVRWKNEGGTDADLSRNGLSHGSGDMSIVETHIGKAHTHFEDNDIESAIVELFAAGERLKVHQNLVRTSIDSAITRLSTAGCHASAPHPKALSLVRLRNTLPT